MKKAADATFFSARVNAKGTSSRAFSERGDGFYDKTPELAFGVMYHGITYADEAYDDKTKGRMTVNLWTPVMKNGIIKFLRPEDCPFHKPLHETKIKIFGSKKNNFSGIKEFDEVN